MPALFNGKIENEIGGSFLAPILKLWEHRGMGRELRLGIITTGLAGTCLILMMRVMAGDLDSPELIGAVRDLGQAHPPGHPSYVGLSAPFMLLPVGDAAFRLSLFSAFCMALSCGLLSILIDGIIRRVQPAASTRVTLVISALFSLLAVLVPGVVEQGIRPEVYACHILLAVLGLHMLLKLNDEPDNLRVLLSLGIIEGLGLANHSYLTTLSFLPVTAWLLLRPPGRRIRRIGLCSAGLLVGLLPYLALAANDPVSSPFVWHDTRTWHGFSSMVSAAQFQASVTAEAQISYLANIETTFEILLDSIHWLPLLFGVGGLSLLLVRRRDIAVIYGLVLLGALFSKSLMYMDPLNPDDRGYLALGMCLWVLVGGVFASMLVQAIMRLDSSTRLREIAVIGSLLLIGVVLVERVVVSHGLATEEQTRPNESIRYAFSELPVGSLALTSYYQLHFLMQYGQQVEGRRPDITESQLSMGGEGANRADLKELFTKRHPQWVQYADLFKQEKGFPLVELFQLAQTRSILMEPDSEFFGLYHPCPPVSREEQTRLLMGLYPHMALKGVFWHLSPPVNTPCDPASYGQHMEQLVADGRYGAGKIVEKMLNDQRLFHLRRGHVGCARRTTDLLAKALGGPVPQFECQVEYLESNQGNPKVRNPFIDLRFPNRPCEGNPAAYAAYQTIPCQGPLE
ncbi:MAG: hypothetical protein CMH54_04835 [Myxococcales bacterium]|nr:hypothetical protein [Myxococcales bacterium]